MEIARIRNVAVIGPHGVGKTTLVEAMLYDMKALTNRGRVEDGTAATDFESEEHQRGMSVGTGVASGEWQGSAITLLDTPGHPDFATDARYALAAADAAVLVLHAAKGVTPEVRKSFRRARGFGLPVMVFINAEDAEGALPYDELIGQIKSELDPHAVLLEVPLGRGKGFKGEVDLIDMHTHTFAPGAGTDAETDGPPGDLRGEAEKRHIELVEAIAEQHDELLERYLEGQEPSREELIAHLRRDMAEGKLMPVLLGSAETNVAIQPLLGMIATLCPSPADRVYPDMIDTETQAPERLAPEPGAPLAAVVFKTFFDPYVGKMSVFRVLRGTVMPDAHLLAAQRGTPERLGRLFKLVGKKTVPVDRLGPGEIGAVAKLKEAQTGDTLVAEGHPTRLLRFPMPEPTPAIWSIAIAPAAKQDEAKLAVSLQKLKEEDPALSVTTEPRTHRTVVAGAGATHLEVALSRLSSRYHLEVSRAEPQIPYRETIRGTAEGQGRHKKQTGGRGQYGDVWLRIEPLPRGAGFEFVDAVVGGAVPRNFIPAVEKGVRESLEMGLLAGYPITDVRVTLYDGSSHSVDSSEQAFKTAAHLALRNIFFNADPVLLEPVMEVSIAVPTEFLGDVMGDLNTRRARIEGVEDQVVRATLPLAELAGLVAALQGMTRGQGTIDSSFKGYEEVPAHMQTKLVNELKAQESAAS